MAKYQREGIEIEICQKSIFFYVTTNLNTLSRLFSDAQFAKVANRDNRDLVEF